jgi:flagellar hook protein FlgE
VNARRNFNQGNVQITSGAFDAAIEGNGFFIVQNSSGQQLYTRDGAFSVDASGNLVDSNGDQVLGWTTSNGVLNASGAPGAITIPTGSTVAPTATTQFSLNANLDATAQPTGASSTFSAPITIVDSLGAKHTLNVTFTNTGPGAWDYNVTIPAADMKTPPTGTPAPTTSSVAKGSLTFDSNGQLTSPSSKNGAVTVKIPDLADGVPGFNINWNLYSSANSPTLTQYAQASALSSTSQDGVPAAQLTQVALGDGGTLIATFSDGTQQTMGQIALAGIANPESLIAVGQNNFALGGDSAAPAIGAAGTGGRGQIKAGALESSNVDIATEFTNLMTFQRSYQADSRAIQTQDQILADLMQIKG